MITVAIGGMSFPLAQVSEGWINQMITEARKRSIPLCVQVNIQVQGVAQMTLSTPGCGAGGPGGRPPNPTEARLFESWRKKGLQEGQFTPGDLRSFLAELGRLE